MNKPLNPAIGWIIAAIAAILAAIIGGLFVLKAAQIPIEATQTAEAKKIVSGSNITVTAPTQELIRSTPTIRPISNDQPTKTPSTDGTHEQTTTSISTPVPQLGNLTPITTSDAREIAARTLGFNDLDSLMTAFSIPRNIRSRIYLCPKEETWCLGVWEDRSQPDFEFHNIFECELDGKLPNGASKIPVAFFGKVRGFTIRPCK